MAYLFIHFFIFINSRRSLNGHLKCEDSVVAYERCPLTEELSHRGSFPNIQQNSENKPLHILFEGEFTACNFRFPIGLTSSAHSEHKGHTVRQLIGRFQNCFPLKVVAVA